MSTYKRPIPNTPSRSFFWRFGMSRLLITPIGRRAVAQSVTMLIAAFAYLIVLATEHDTRKISLHKLTRLPGEANTSGR